MKLLRIVGADFDVRDQLIITHSAFVIGEKKWKYNKSVHQLFIDFKKARNSVNKKGFYNILTEHDVPTILVRR